MRLIATPLLLTLVGCASGSVISSTSATPSSASLLTAAPGVLVGIGPLHTERPWTQIDSTIGAELWVSSGWFLIDFNCNVVPDKILLDESGTQRSIRIQPGRTYALECDVAKVGVIHLKELGAAPNQPLHPDALTRAGERRRYLAGHD